MRGESWRYRDETTPGRANLRPPPGLLLLVPTVTGQAPQDTDWELIGVQGPPGEKGSRLGGERGGCGVVAARLRAIVWLFRIVPR